MAMGKRTGRKDAAAPERVERLEASDVNSLIEKLLKVRVDCSISPLSFGKEMTEFLKKEVGVDRETIVVIRDGIPKIFEESDAVPRPIIRSGAGHSPDCPAVTGKPLFTMKSAPESICNECKPGCRVGQPMLRIPVFLNDRITSVITLSFKSTAAISNELFVKTLANTLALEVKSFQQSRVIALLEIMDNITGVYNHRYFIKALQQEIDRSRRYDHMFTLFIADMDYFRDFNDMYGHDVGDLMLHEAAMKMKSCIRTTDLIARFSGQQFALILTETGPSGVLSVKRKLRTAVSKIALNVPNHDKPLTASISLGHAVFPVDATMPSRLIFSADSAMRAEKNSRKPRHHKQ